MALYSVMTIEIQGMGCGEYQITAGKPEMSQ